MPKLVTVFPQALKAARKRRGYSQEELAQHANIAPSYVSMLERGQRIPPLDTVDALAAALDVEPTSLFRSA